MGQKGTGTVPDAAVLAAQDGPFEQAERLCKFREGLQREGMIFAYCGYVSEDVLSGVGDAVRRKLAIEEESLATIRNVFAVFVEQMQNIIRYSSEQLDQDQHSKPGDKVSYGILTVGEIDGTYVIQAGNAILTEKVPALHSQLERLRVMDKAEMKAAYKEQLKKEPTGTEQGAGIGLIEIARRATRPLSFDFYAMDETHTFFAIEARV